MADDQGAMRDKLESLRKQRLLQQKLAGSSLGEQLASAEMDSVAQWVVKHSTQPKHEPRGKKRGARAAGAVPMASQDDEDTSSSMLAGAVVGHGVDDFKEGESTILTLADQSVIAEDEDGSYKVNDDEEMLENVNMAEEWRRKKAKELASKSTLSTHGNGAGAILDKYDEDKKMERTKLVLDQSGQVDEVKQKKLAAIKQRLEATQGGGSGQLFDLSAVGASAPRTFGSGDDFMSQEEARALEAPAAFKKPKRKDGTVDNEGKKKRRKKHRERDDDDRGGGGTEKLDLDAMAAAEAAAGSHHSSIASRGARAEEWQAEASRKASERRERFDRALATADEQSKAMETKEDDVEQDVELYAALSRARRLGAKPKESAAGDAAAAAVAAMVQRTSAARSAAGGDDGDEAEAGATEFASLEFSETGEFCKAVRGKDDDADTSAELPSMRFSAVKTEQERSRAEGGASFGGREGGASSTAFKVKAEVKPKTDPEEGVAGESGSDEDEDQEEDGTEGNGLGLLHERNASSGMAAVLDMARNRGMLKGDEEVTAGRTFDTKGAGLHAYDEGGGGGKEPSFHLDHYDEYGRKMTAKQAFRQLSWKFHGKGPSKKNREKRMLEVEKQLAEKKEDKAMGHLQALQAAQQSTKSAHVVLTGIHAIKPSEVLNVRKAASGESKK